jgi:hypothetical protein
MRHENPFYLIILAFCQLARKILIALAPFLVERKYA